MENTDANKYGNQQDKNIKKPNFADRAGDALERVGKKIADAGAEKLGQKIHDAGDRLEQHHNKTDHPEKV